MSQDNSDGDLTRRNVLKSAAKASAAVTTVTLGAAGTAAASENRCTRERRRRSNSICPSGVALETRLCCSSMTGINCTDWETERCL